MFDKKLHSLKMDKAIEVFSKELSSLRTGRANAAMLDLVKIDVYGQQMPINQIGSITTPEPRMINIQVWDQSNVNLIDAAIKKSELGLNPQIDGQLIRLPIPELNEERRTELKKLIKFKFEEQKKFLGAKILRLMPMILKDRVLEKRYKKIMNIQKSSITVQPGSVEAAFGDREIL